MRTLEAACRHLEPQGQRDEVAALYREAIKREPLNPALYASLVGA